jgi:serine/threonine protein kinase
VLNSCKCPFLSGHVVVGVARKFVGKEMDGLHGNYEFKILDRIGQGGFGYVESVELFNIAGHKCGVYARKYLLGEFEDELAEFRRRFEREVTYQAHCKHTNVAHIYLCDLKATPPWFIMDLADSDLQKDIDTKTMTKQQKIAAMSMVLEGVAHIHERNYLHRDIKPNNVLRFDDTYKVSDFGLVKNLDVAAESEVLTKIATVMGTNKYRSPEVITAAQYSVRSDIFSLGVLMEDLGFPDTSPVHEVIRKSTQRRPLERYADVNEMKKDFIEAAQVFSK